MSSYKNIYLFLLSGYILLSTGCSTVRLAVYDYQKRYDTVKESYAREHSSQNESIASFESLDKKESKESKEVLAKKALIAKASNYIGTNYRYGSCDASKGFDCSGLVYHVAKSQEVMLPRSSSSMATIGPQIPWKKAQQGDLIFFGDKGGINHVGIVDKNKGDEMWIIHSTNSLGVIREDILVSDYWRKRVLFAVNIFSPKDNVKT